MDEVIMMIHRDNWPTQYHTSVHPSCYYYTTPNFCDQIFHYHLKKLSKVTPKDFDEAIKKFDVCVYMRACLHVCVWSLELLGTINESFTV